MTLPTFQQFEAAAHARGFDEVVARRWEPGAIAPRHTHPFAVDALVVQGEMWLTVGDAARHLRAGDRFELAFEVAHAECYSSEGATYRAARRTAENR